MPASRFESLVASKDGIDIEQVLGATSDRPPLHVTHLHLHRDDQGNQHDGDDVLQDNEHLRQHHLVAEAERTLHHIDGFGARHHYGRDDARQQCHDHHNQQIREQIERRKRDFDSEVAAQQPVD